MKLLLFSFSPSHSNNIADTYYYSSDIISLFNCLSFSNYQFTHEMNKYNETTWKKGYFYAQSVSVLPFPHRILVFHDSERRHPLHGPPRRYQFSVVYAQTSQSICSLGLFTTLSSDSPFANTTTYTRTDIVRHRRFACWWRKIEFVQHNIKPLQNP